MHTGRRGRRQHQPVEFAAHLATRQGRRAVVRQRPRLRDSRRRRAPRPEPVPARLAGQDRDHRRRPAARRRGGHQRLPRRRAAALPLRRHGYEDRRHAGRRPGLHPQPERELVLRHDRRARQHARDRLRAGRAPLRHADVRRGRLPGIRHARRAHDLVLRPDDRAGPGARRCRARVPGRPGLPRRVGPDGAERGFRPGFPAPVNDLQFLTGPAVGQITARGGQAVVEGTSSQDLEAFGAGGTPASGGWPKLTGDWIAATPTLGSFGTLDTAPRRPQGRRLDHAVRRAVRVPDASPGVLAELLAAVPPRQRELRRLHARRRRRRAPRSASASTAGG